MKLTDMHSHILPGVDDGARDIEETLDVLRMAKEQRVSRIILTPHFHPGRYQVSADEVLAKMKEIQAACDKEGIDIKLYPGHECYYYSVLQSVKKNGICEMQFVNFSGKRAQFHVASVLEKTRELGGSSSWYDN